jgi:hypothetical protein
MTDPDQITKSEPTTTLKLTNAARLGLTAVATEVGPLRDGELYLAAFEVATLLRDVPNTFSVGEKLVDIPRALHGIERLKEDDPQRLGVLQLADQWKLVECEITMPTRLAAVLKLQIDWILENQSKGTRVGLPIDPACAELVRLFIDVR